MPTSPVPGQFVYQSGRAQETPRYYITENSVSRRVTRENIDIDRVNLLVGNAREELAASLDKNGFQLISRHESALLNSDGGGAFYDNDKVVSQC
eukprot:UC4_evm1s1348